ncbi:unnamed protein product [Moneuplotes crassus]|uniref:Uncharacterized protein n=1 Tax=Euplotes crassus TaxID=5936 RepID=A0AAD1XCD5_EUPCR|nr:unnamed protein product [Moneuplotes crassus]
MKNLGVNYSTNPRSSVISVKMESKSFHSTYSEEPGQGQALRRNITRKSSSSSTGDRIIKEFKKFIKKQALELPKTVDDSKVLKALKYCKYNHKKTFDLIRRNIKWACTSEVYESGRDSTKSLQKSNPNISARSIISTKENGMDFSFKGVRKLTTDPENISRVTKSNGKREFKIVPHELENLNENERLRIYSSDQSPAKISAFKLLKSGSFKEVSMTQEGRLPQKSFADMVNSFQISPKERQKSSEAIFAEHSFQIINQKNYTSCLKSENSQDKRELIVSENIDSDESSTNGSMNSFGVMTTHQTILSDGSKDFGQIDQKLNFEEDPLDPEKESSECQNRYFKLQNGRKIYLWNFD